MTESTTKNFGAVIDRTLKVIKQNYLQEFREMGIDLTTEQWVVLDCLSRGDGITQTDLANNSFKNAPTISRIIDLMRKKGVLEKRQSTDDKRQFFIFLTNEGRKLHKKVLPKVQELRQQGWSGLTADDYNHLMRILNQVEENFTK